MESENFTAKLRNRNKPNKLATRCVFNCVNFELNNKRNNLFKKEYTTIYDEKLAYLAFIWDNNLSLKNRMFNSYEGKNLIFKIKKKNN